MSSFVVGFLPTFMPLAFAFAMPLLTRLRIICNSNSENTPAIFMKASDIGSICPFRQSIVMLPTMTNLNRFLRIVLMISQSCCVDRDSRLTSSVMMVSPSWAVSSSICKFFLTLASVCSYSKMILSAPAALSSRIWRFDRGYRNRIRGESLVQGKQDSRAAEAVFSIF